MQEQEIAIKPGMRVFLKSDTQLIDEVLVVAYGTATKSSFTGSASTLKSDKLAARSVSNVTNALSGQIAGVQVSNTDGGQPGTEATIRIRGIGSMSASNKPLYVVDGVPFDGNIASINSQDIESMTVLKDAAANAIYGARGANGVILITTKKGNTGAAQVTVDAKWGSNSRAVPNYNVMEDPGMYYETFYKALYNSKTYSGSSTAEAYAYADRTLLDQKNGGLGYLVYTVPDGQKLIGTNFKLNPNATLGYSDGQYYYTPDDWYDETFKSSNLRQEYNVSVSGSSEKLNYYMSLGYLDEDGIISGSGFSRYTARAKTDYQAKDWLKVGTNIGYSYYNKKAPTSQTSWGSSGNVFYVTNSIAPIYPMYVRNPDGSKMVDNRGLTVYDFGAGSTNSIRPFMSMSNPAAVLALDSSNAYTDVVNGRFYAILTPIEGLQITANLGLNSMNERFNYLGNPFYGGNVSSDGFVEVSHLRDFSINQQYLANYKKTLNDVHNMDILVGYESYDRKKQKLGGENQQLFNPNVGELSNTIQSPPNKLYSSTDRYTTIGFLTNFKYDFNEKYFLSASYRRDASSRFHPDNRWGNFGSFGGAWLMDKEAFMQDITWVNMLKFKASYGIQGNDNLLKTDGKTESWYAYTDQFIVSNNNGTYAVSLDYKGNKDITWETSYSFNTGFDFELFKGRLNGSIEYFRRKTKDLIYNQPVPISAGYTSIPTNVGKIVNSGFEVDLNGVIFKNREVEWTANINATHVKNEIKDLAQSAKDNGGIKGSNYIYRVGGSLYTLYMPKYAGVDAETGKALYYVDPDNGDYTITDNYETAQQADLGCTLPKVYGGFGTQINAYGFDLSLQFAYQLGGELYDGTYEALMHTGSGSMAGINWHKDILKAWTPENPSGSIPRLSSADDLRQKQSSRFVTSSDYLSLNSAMLGYTFSKRIVNKLSLSSLRLYISGDNLFLITSRTGLDPRSSIGLGSSTTSGNFKYSALRTISGGISVTF